MEEDAGKSLHDGLPDSARWTHLDFNRSGVPLIEIVTRPDLRSAADAAQAFSRVREVLVAIGVNDGNMEEGSLRCDANVSVRPVGQSAFGVKTELKNLNSFRHVQRAIEFEIERHVQAHHDRMPLVQETRLWDPAANRSTVRTKKKRTTTAIFRSRTCRRSLDAAWIEHIRHNLRNCPKRAAAASSRNTICPNTTRAC